MCRWVGGGGWRGAVAGAGFGEAGVWGLGVGEGARPARSAPFRSVRVVRSLPLPSAPSTRIPTHKGRWSANSSVQSECVIPSKASLMQCAKSYMG